MAGILKIDRQDRPQLWLDYLFKRYPILRECRETLLATFYCIRETFNRGGKLLTCGNGGSAADAEHISAELLKGFLKKRPLSEKTRVNILEQVNGDQHEWVNKLQAGLPTIPLTVNNSLLLAVGNDLAEDLVFAQQVIAYGLPGDTLMAISTSGNSPNIIKAVTVAKGLGLKTIGLTGANGGELKKIADFAIKVPANRVYQVQELHLPVYHTLCAMLEDEFF